MKQRLFRLQNGIVVLHMPPPFFFWIFVLLLISFVFPRVCITASQRVMKISCGGDSGKWTDSKE